MIALSHNCNGIPVNILPKDPQDVPDLMFGHLLPYSNYGTGAKLANMFSTEFAITIDVGSRTYIQAFYDNMQETSRPIGMWCDTKLDSTLISVKPDLEKFNMKCLEDDVVALMKKRVVDLGGYLGNTVNVELNGQRISVNSFEEYCKLFFESSEAKREFLKVKDADGTCRWEICVSSSEGQFQQVGFVNGIATVKGGTHVDHVADQIANHIMVVVNRRNKKANINARAVKKHLWIFVNALIDNPAFDSAKETLTQCQSSFGSKCELPPDFLKNVENNIGIVDVLLSWADLKNNKVKVDKLEDANDEEAREKINNAGLKGPKPMPRKRKAAAAAVEPENQAGADEAPPDKKKVCKAVAEDEVVPKAKKKAPARKAMGGDCKPAASKVRHKKS